MTYHTWFLFLLVTSAAITCPGPAIILVVSNALGYRIRTVLFQTLGNLVGLIVITSLVVLGLSNLLNISPEIFMAVKYCGAGYIIYIGLQQLASSSPLFARKKSRSQPTHKRDIFAFTEGMIVAITNPQTLIFFLALFPSFLDLSAPIVPQYLILTASILVVSFTSLMGYGYLTHRAKGLLECPTKMNMLQRTIGIFMMLVGLGLLVLPTNIYSDSHIEISSDAELRPFQITSN